MRALARLRWGAFGLRGRFVGAVVVTTAVTLLVAATILLPQLEHRLQIAARTTLKRDVRSAEADQDLSGLQRIPYTYVAFAGHDGRSSQHRIGLSDAQRIGSTLAAITQRLGATQVQMIGYIDRQGRGRLVSVGQGIDPDNHSAPGAGVSAEPRQDYSDVGTAFLTNKPVYSFGNLDGSPVVRAAIPLGGDSVLAVRKSIDEIPEAVRAVTRAFAIAALVAIVLTFLLAIPLAGTLVRRLQRLREAALQIAVGGSGSADAFPEDNARDEVGDLARSFRIMQRRLRRQEEARRAFVATASHELRTPLASLDGMLELLAEDLQAENIALPEAAALLDRARSQSRRLGRLAADLLDLSRIDAEVPLRSEPLELSELVRAVIAEFDLASAVREVDAVLRDSGTQVWALADPGSVARILRILLDNALRIAPPGSEVTVTVTPGPEPTLSVADRGPGVAAEERALIFERFKRGTETGGEAGFGLGLAIGRELASRMGGSLQLADTDGSSGATFTLTLRPTVAPAEDRTPTGIEA